MTARNPAPPPVDVSEELRREASLVTRIAAGAGIGAVVAAPFVLILALVVSQSEWLARIDATVANRLNEWASTRPWVVMALEIVERVTSPWSFRLVVLFAAALLWRAGSRRLATWAVTTMAVGGLLNLALKELVARARPTFSEPVASADNYSFPSGHAQNSMMGVAVLLLILLPLLSRRGKAVAWAAGIFVVLLTGFDRVGLGVHYLSDVVAGWIVALAVVVAATVAFGAPHRGLVVAEGIDEISSRRLLRPPTRQDVPAAVHAGVPVLLAQTRSLFARLLLGTALIWGVVVAMGLLVTALDEQVWPLTVEERWMQQIAAARTQAWNDVTAVMRWIADTTRIEISLVLVAVVFRLVYRRWREAVFVVAAVAMQALAFVSATAVIARPRPDVIMEAAPPTSSFPSGHTGAALALYLSIALVLAWHTRATWLRVLIWILLLLPPVCVAYASVYRGTHFPSDLLGSVAAAGLAITFAARQVLFASLPPQLHDVLDTSVLRRHAPIAPEPPSADARRRAGPG